MINYKHLIILMSFFLSLEKISCQESLTINLAPIGIIGSEIESLTDNILIQVVNNSGAETNVYFVVNITCRRADGPTITIDNILSAPDHVVNIPRSGLTFTLTNLIEQFQNSRLEDFNIVPSSVIAQIESTRGLPAGAYSICLEARSITTNQVISTPGTNNCLSFEITQRNPPIIQSPENNTWVAYSDLGEIRIQWAHDIPNPNTTFQLEVIRFPSSAVANDFLNQGSPHQLFEIYERILLEENIREWSFNTLNADVMPNLDPGDILGARVTAISENSLFRNNGRSNIVVFFYGVPQSILCNNPTLTADWAFPSVGDTLPFTEIFPVARFEPSCDNLLDMRADIHFARSYGGSTVGASTVRDYYDNWRSGPGPSNYLRNYFQRNFPGQLDYFFPNNSDYEQYLPFLHDDRNFTAQRGETVNIFGGLTFTKSVIPNNSITTQSLSLNAMNTRGVVIGMPVPQLQNPIYDAQIRTGGTVNFEFKTGETPGNPLPPFKIFKLDGSRSPLIPRLHVFEKCVLQVATEPTFAPNEIVFCTLKKIQGNPYNNSDNYDENNPVMEPLSSVFDVYPQRQFDQDHYIQQVYKDLNTSAVFDQEDTLYWRVVWLKDPASVNVLSPCQSGISIHETQIYHKSETRRLIINDRAEEDDVNPVVYCSNFFEIQDDEVSPPGSSNKNCQRICNLPEIPESQRVAVTGIAVGEDITIGNYIFTISTISSSGSAYSGSGVLNLNSNVKLRVSFTGAKINASRKMFEGVVTANSENRSELPRTNTTEMAAIVDGMSELTRFAEAVSGTPTNLPLGIDFTAASELRIVGALDKATFRPTGARASYLIGVKLPEEMDGVSILFAADDLCLHPDGAAGAGKYMLAADLDADLSNGWRLGISGSRDTMTATYVEFDCDGFKALAFRGRLVFSRDALVPENVTTGAIVDGQVSAVFGTKIDKNAKFLIGLTFDKPFQFTALPQFGFTVNTAILDFSETENYEGMRFPALYDLARLPSPPPSSTPPPAGASPEDRLRKSWTGFYLRELSLRLPKDLSTPRPGIGIGDVLIDPSGVSFEVRTTGVWATPQASDHGYSLSLDTLAIGLIQTNIGYGRITGGIGLPIFEDGDLLNYSAILAIGGTSPPPGEERPAERTEGSDAAASDGPNINFIFRVRPDATGLNIPMWDIARIRLEPTTNVSLSIGSNFEFSFSLTGAVTFLSSNNDSRASNMSINFPSIRVENLAFSTARSGIRGRISLVESGRTTQLWAQASPQKDVSGFPINLNGINISLVSGSLTRYDIRFDLRINFGDKIGGGADLGFRFNLGREGSPDFSKFTFEEFLAPTSIEIRAEDLGGLDLYGRIAFCNSGLSERFIGELRVGIPSVGQINLYADFGTQRNNTTAAFNTSDYYSFFAIEGSVVLSTGITLFPGVALYGIGGGVFYHMRRTAPLPTLTAPPVNETAGATVSTNNRSTLPPATPIGCARAPFEPHFLTFLGFGFKAYLGDNGGGSAYNFDVGIEATIAGNPDGSVRGLQRVVFDGNLYVSCGIGRGNDTAPLRARVNIAWTKGVDGDDNYEGIHGTVEVYLNLYSIVTGAGTANKMVDAVFHADNRDMWYFYLGAPRGIQDRTFPAPGVAGGTANYPGPAGIRALGALTLETYFMIGKGIPDLPPPHPRIEAILARAAGDAEQERVEENISTLPRPSNPTTMETGDGFAHGLNFELNSDFNFLLFYASLDMVMGYNINLRQYPGRSCRIISASGASEERPLGINGWYAKGDAYAGIEGEMGLGVNFDFFQAKVPIINLGCAISLQAEFPSPEHFKGRAGLYYDILNGAVTGRCNFVFEVGNKCYDPNYSPLDGLKFITDLKPEGNQISVYTRAQAAFAFAMDRVLPLKDDQYEGPGELIRYFRPQFKRFLITRVSDGSIVEFRPPVISENGFMADTRAISALRENTAYTIRAEVIVFERIGGRWVQVRKRDGTEFVDFMVKSFTTGPHPTTFIPENILMTYPIQKQRNFMTGEKGEKGTNRNGWVILDVEDPILLEPSGRRAIEETPVSGTSATIAQNITSVSYQIHIRSAETMDPAVILEAERLNAKSLKWIMPDNLPLNRRYTLKVMKIINTRRNPLLEGTNKLTFQTIRRSFQVADIAASTADIKKAVLSNEDVSDNASNMELLKFYFRTSRFATLYEKMLANSFVVANRGLFGIDIKFNLAEPFDEFDKDGYVSSATGRREIPPLVFLHEDYSNFWFNNMKSKVYTYGKDLKATRWTHAFRPADYALSMFTVFMNDIRTTRNPYWAFPERNAVDVTYNTFGSWVEEPLPQIIGLGTVSSPLNGSELTSLSESASGTVYSVVGMAPGIAVGATAPTLSVYCSNEWMWTTHARDVKNISQSIVSRMNRVIATSRVNEYRTLVSIGDLFSVRSGHPTMNFTNVYNTSIGPVSYPYLPFVNYNIDWFYIRPGDRSVKRISTNWRF